MNDEELKKENKVQDIVAITENFKSKEINDDENSLLEENNIGHIPIKILKRKLCVSLIGVFLGACYYTWSLTGHWNISNGLQNNKIYIGIGLTIAIMIVIFCVAMLILEKQQKKIDPVNEDQLDDDIFSAVIGRINFEELDGLSTEEIGERTQKAQLVRAEFDAKMSELRFYKELGELIHIEDVERVNSRIAAAVRAALLGIPAKLSPALEGLPVDKINDELQEEVNTILEQLSSLKYTPEEELQSA